MNVHEGLQRRAYYSNPDLLYKLPEKKTVDYRESSLPFICWYQVLTEWWASTETAKEK